MRKNMFWINIAGIVFVSLAGSFMHFAYAVSGKAFVVGLFCSINESTWEHLKLLFFPYLIYSVIEYFLLNKEKIFFAKAVGASAGMLFIVAFFYTYTGVLGRNNPLLDIGSFLIGVCISFFTDNLLIKSEKTTAGILNYSGIAYFIFMSILFFIFTVAPPQIPLFRDPVTLTYGI